MHLLVVEDDTRLAAILKKGLAEEGYQVSTAHNGADGLATAHSAAFDLILLDVLLPGIDGFEVVRRLRANGSRTPILLLTARDTPADIVTGLDLGADDYLAKPFDFDVLLARVRAAIRRGPAPQSVRITVGKISLDTASRVVAFAGQTVNLTRIEYRILELLMRRAGHVVPREVIIEEVWGFDRDVESNTLDVYFSMLRSKVDPDPDDRRIQTVRGVGYLLRRDGER